MKINIMAMCALIILLGTSSLCTAAEDTMTCALTRAIECFPDEGCKNSSIDEMALPRFVSIDLTKKTIVSLDKELPRTTKIASIERLEGMTVLHGTEFRGWSIALGEKSGEITLTAAGDGEGFIVFGACIKK